VPQDIVGLERFVRVATQVAKHALDLANISVRPVGAGIMTMEMVVVVRLALSHFNQFQDK